MLARIYKPAKTAMQSGHGKAKDWILEFEPASAVRPDPLMGWGTVMDPNRQISLSFDTKEEAVAYAESHGIAFRLHEPPPSRIVIKAYADNFAYNRKQPWTH